MLINILLFEIWMLYTVKGSYAGNNQFQFCPDNVRNNGNHVVTRNKTCYLFVDIEKYWDEARSYCWHMGGEMVIMENIQTMQFIQRQLNSPKLGWNRNGVWTGASDLRSRGWEWTTGEKLKFTFWSQGQPSKFLGLLSFENCALMLREDNWRWHDYHCHTLSMKYNFICQFPFVYQEHIDTDILKQQDHGAPLIVTDDRAAIIGLLIGGVVLITLMCTVILYLHRKHKRQKAVLKQSRPAIRYQNTGYATIIQQSREGSSSQLLLSAPQGHGNMYLEPHQVSRIYEEVVQKDAVNHGVNSLSSTRETTRLAYQGGAASLENLEDNGYLTPTMSNACISSATSGYCSTNNVDSSGNAGEYMEMTPPNSLGGQIRNDLSPKSAGASGDSSDLVGQADVASDKGSCQNGVKCNGQSQNGGPKCSNLYVTASAALSGAAKIINKSAGTNGSVSADKSEMHIYTNQMDKFDNSGLDNYSMRPLPPVPSNENIVSSENS